MNEAHAVNVIMDPSLLHCAHIIIISISISIINILSIIIFLVLVLLV